MKRYFGTVVRGIRTPIVKSGEDVAKIVTDSVIEAVRAENIKMRDKDVVAVTESLVARAQNNYASTHDIACDVRSKFSKEFGVVFPILSRNRFSIILKGLAESGLKMHILLSYPSDEVGNHLMNERDLFNKKINPYTDVLDEDEYEKLFGKSVHPFTGINYVDLYKSLAPNSEIHFSNDPRTILKFTDEVLVASIHTRDLVKDELKEAGAKVVYGLDDLLSEKTDKHGYNEDYGVLGSNLAGDTDVKLFPRDGQQVVDKIKEILDKEFGVNVEVMIYGDGAFKDPVGQIWELADPVVSPAHTAGLAGTPNEIKIKYIADNDFKDLKGEELIEAMVDKIEHKNKNLVGTNETLGTTPRRITDLIGSLSDLTSGSGDKGTPVVLIQGYFDNYSDN